MVMSTIVIVSVVLLLILIAVAIAGGIWWYRNRKFHTLQPNRPAQPLKPVSPYPPSSSPYPPSSPHGGGKGPVPQTFKTYYKELQAMVGKINNYSNEMQNWSNKIYHSRAQICASLLNKYTLARLNGTLNVVEQLVQATKEPVSTVYHNGIGGIIVIIKSLISNVQQLQKDWKKLTERRYLYPVFQQECHSDWIANYVASVSGVEQYSTAVLKIANYMQ